MTCFSLAQSQRNTLKTGWHVAIWGKTDIPLLDCWTMELIELGYAENAPAIQHHKKAGEAKQLKHNLYFLVLSYQ